MYEENPFKEEYIAKQWISSVESEKDGFRDREIYPRLRNWKKSVDGSTFLEIGCGQGICCSQLEMNEGETYIGIEPSEILVNRAVEVYEQPNRIFKLGNAYDLCIDSNSIEGAFSVAVWFHLEDLTSAAAELARVLKTPGAFMIITANPSCYSSWMELFSDYERHKNRIVGEFNAPNNLLSRNTAYFHTLEDIKNSLQLNGLEIIEIEPLGGACSEDRVDYFIEISGRKLVRGNDIKTTSISFV